MHSLSFELGSSVKGFESHQTPKEESLQLNWRNLYSKPFEQTIVTGNRHFLAQTVKLDFLRVTISISVSPFPNLSN